MFFNGYVNQIDETTLLYSPYAYYYNYGEVVEYTIEDQNGLVASATILILFTLNPIIVNDECIILNPIGNDHNYLNPLEITNNILPQFETLDFDTLTKPFIIVLMVLLLATKFTYEVNNEASATVLINTVEPTLPNAINDFAQSNINQFEIIDVLANDEFIIIPQLSDVADPENGTVTISEINSLIYSPNENFDGIDCFQYAILNTSTLLFDIAEVCVEVSGMVGLFTITTNSISVYPNPSSNYINVVFEKPSEFQIFSQFGILIKSGFSTSPNVTLNVQDLERGIYYIKVENQITKFTVY